MAKTREADRMPDERTAREYVEELKSTPGVVTRGDEQQLARQQAVDGVVRDPAVILPATEAERVQKWVTHRKYGPSMTKITQYIAANALDTADLNAVIMEQMAE